MADMIEMDSALNDDEILDAIDAVFDGFSYLWGGVGRIGAELVNDLTIRCPDKEFRSTFRLWKAVFALLFMIDHRSPLGH